MKPLVLIVACLLAAPAWAQSASQPLNLKLPPQSDMPPTDLPASSASLQRCDDSTYNQAQVHGSVGMGVVAGNHASGNYQTGTVSVSKQLGDCDHPSGSVNFSIGVGQGHFHGRGW